MRNMYCVHFVPILRQKMKNISAKGNNIWVIRNLRIYLVRHVPSPWLSYKLHGLQIFDKKIRFKLN
jgi:hypothetical protein